MITLEESMMVSTLFALNARESLIRDLVVADALAARKLCLSAENVASLMIDLIICSVLNVANPSLLIMKF